MGSTGNNVAFTLVGADTAATKVSLHLLQHTVGRKEIAHQYYFIMEIDVNNEL